MSTIKNVDYDTLDKAKNAFISASRSTLKFAGRFGFIPGESLGASANVFSLDLKPFLKNNTENLYITLLPEGLGTADDARPEDLSAAELSEFWRNIGGKTVSVLTNDAASGGFQTILISLYLPSANPEIVFDPSFMEGFLGGFVDGCREVGCVYFSGETPQLKNKICEGKLDIAGALFAICPPGITPVDSAELSDGHSIVLVESSGPHENGFTVLRELAAGLPQGYRTKLDSGEEFWRAISRASKLYTPLVQAVLAAGIRPSAIENITGHGWQKIMRSSRPLRYRITEMLAVPEVFRFVEKAAGFTPEQMINIFNYGAGMAFFLKSASDAREVVRIAGNAGLKAVVAGGTEKADKREVLIEPLGVTLKSDGFALQKG